ncbi:MAG TPA: amidase [Streptosporangiaceae bacterium]|jgi:amidase
MATFITRLPADVSGTGVRLAVKDLIDVAGTPTTAGSRALAESAEPAASDAPCMAGARAAGAVIVGKANLFELAYGASGVNDYFGTPVNPLDPGLVPGGSSSGSAVAVATGEADVAYGSDTGGSIRIPSAFCGTTGLKTTHARISIEGVWPLAPSLDTVGPMARDVAGVAAGMALLEPGFTVDREPARRIGRLRPSAGMDIDPAIDAAVDAALAASGIEVVEVELPGWLEARSICGTILDYEAVQSNRKLLDDPARRELLGAEVLARLRADEGVTDEELAAARAAQPGWRAAMFVTMRDVDVLALPTVGFFPPPLTQAPRQPYTALTNPVNLSGYPALALPVPTSRPLPASLQLIGPPEAEALLLATGAVVEKAVQSQPGRAG